MTGFLLHLYGPMQSWADTGFGQLREAGVFPSRAAVLGIVAAAMGVPRADEKLVALHEHLRVHVATLRPGRVLRDFHTVETREGRARTLTSRDYHHDAHFVALVVPVSEAGEAVLHEAAEALRAPVYPTFLGRRACPPAVPLLPVPVEGDPFAALREATLATAEHLSGDEQTRRWGRSGESLLVWLDGHFDTPPSAFSEATVSHGTRRAHLSGARRAYTSAPYTHLRASRLPLAASADADHQAYFDAAS